MRVFAFVLRQKADFPVKTLCRVCRVSTSGYYGWVERDAAGPTVAQAAEADLVERIRLVHAESRGRYGEPRVTEQLARDGVVVNHKRVERLMARAGLRGRGGRRRMRTTIADPTKVPAADLVKRQFNRDELDQLWIGDATYIATDEAGCSSLPSSTRARGGCWAGRSPTISAPSCASTRSAPRSARGAGNATFPA